MEVHRGAWKLHGGQVHSIIMHLKHRYHISEQGFNQFQRSTYLKAMIYSPQSHDLLTSKPWTSSAVPMSTSSSPVWPGAIKLPLPRELALFIGFDKSDAGAAMGLFVNVCGRQSMVDVCDSQPSNSIDQGRQKIKSGIIHHYLRISLPYSNVSN